MPWSLLLALAVSLDGLAAGVTYGLRQIKVPWRSLGVIALCTTAGVLVAVLAGDWAAGAVLGTVAHRLGAILLIVLGSCVVLEAWANSAGQRTPKLTIKLRSIALVVQVLREPGAADVDRSGSISPTEALTLGAALALDATAASFGAALAGLVPGYFPVVAGGACALLVLAGTHLGRTAAVSGWVPRLAYLPGGCLVLLGVLRLI
ncbi:MAG: sporulation membrane protein YtaF [Bacillota bacterium]